MHTPIFYKVFAYTEKNYCLMSRKVLDDFWAGNIRYIRPFVSFDETIFIPLQR